MSQNTNKPKRYNFKTIGLGEWVKYADYAALAAENERLRKAGDAIVEDNLKWMTNHDQIAAWNAAKEGRDAK